MQHIFNKHAAHMLLPITSNLQPFTSKVACELYLIRELHTFSTKIHIINFERNVPDEG